MQQPTCVSYWVISLQANLHCLLHRLQHHLDILREYVANYVYLSILHHNNIKPSVQRWYVIHIENYIKYYPNQRLNSHTKDNIEYYLKEIDRKNTINDFQFFQNIDALSLLFCQLLEVSWCQSVDWEYWKASARSLSKSHPTIARDNTKNIFSEKQNTRYSSTHLLPVRQKHHDILQSLVAKIRTRQYSIAKPTRTYSRPERSTLGVRRLQKLITSLRYGIFSKKCKDNSPYLICAHLIKT